MHHKKQLSIFCLSAFHIVPNAHYWYTHQFSPTYWVYLLRPENSHTLLWDISRASLPKKITATAAPRRQTLFGLSCYILSATMANVDEHFWLFYNLSTNTFQRLEVSRGKYPIIKYRHFFASLNKLSKWEKNCVCTNNGRLVIYEGNNATIVIRPWTFFGFGLPFLVFRGIIDRHFSIIRLVAAKIAEHFLMSAEIFLWTLKSVCRFLHSLIEKIS